MRRADDCLLYPRPGFDKAKPRNFALGRVPFNPCRVHLGWASFTSTSSSAARTVHWNLYFKQEPFLSYFLVERSLT